MHQSNYWNTPCLVAIVDCTHEGLATASFEDLVTLHSRALQQTFGRRSATTSFGFFFFCLILMIFINLLAESVYCGVLTKNRKKKRKRKSGKNKINTYIADKIYTLYSLHPNNVSNAF